MTVSPAVFLECLGREESSREVLALIERFGLVSDDARAPLVYWESADAGVELRSMDGVVEAIFLHGPTQGDGLGPYAGELPHGLDFGDSVADVRSKVGAPESSSPPRSVEPVHGGWDRFEVDGAVLHVTYDATSRALCLVTFMP